MQLKQLLICAAVLLTISLQSMAQPGTITMKNGTEYKGYIAKQNFDKEATVTIKFTQMIINVDMTAQNGVVSESVRLSDLSKEWQKWVIDNGKAESNGSEKVVTLSTMSIQGYERMKYYVMERGSKYAKCITLTPGQAQCKMSDIYCSLKPLREATLLTDIDDIVATKFGTFVGVLLEQYPGKQMKIWDKKDKTIHIANSDEVLYVGKAVFNPELPMWCQTPVVERLRTKEGYYSDYGLITRYGNEITLVTKTTTQLFQISDLLSLERIDNPDYAPVYDIFLAPNEVVLNRDKKLSFIDFDERTYSNTFSLYVLDSSKEKDLTPISDNKVTIETSMPDISDVYVVEAKRREITVSKKEKKQMWSYSFGDVFKSAIKVVQSKSMNGTTKIDFSLPSPGVYVVFVKSIGRTWVINYNPSVKASSSEGIVVIGNKKFLEKAGVPKDLSKLNVSDIKTKYSTRVDKASCKEIKVPSTKYQILSEIDKASYTIDTDSNGGVVLKIINSESFWGKIGCVVIQLK